MRVSYNLVPNLIETRQSCRNDRVRYRVWENSKKLWKVSPISVSHKFPLVFLYLIELTMGIAFHFLNRNGGVCLTSRKVTKVYLSCEASVLSVSPLHHSCLTKS